MNIISISDNLISFRLLKTDDNLALATEINTILKKEKLYARKQGYETKAIKTTDITRISRCRMFKTRNRTVSQSRYEPRRESRDNNQAFGRLDLSSAEKERAFFKEKLNVCIKDYENMFQDALLTKEYVKLEKYVNEVFKIFNIPKTKENYDKVTRDNTLFNLLRDKF